MYAALDGFAWGGLLSTGRPSAATSIFPEEGHEEEALLQFMQQHEDSPIAQELANQLVFDRYFQKGGEQAMDQFLHRHQSSRDLIMRAFDRYCQKLQVERAVAQRMSVFQTQAEAHHR
jgi:hypothetical protein